jgi:hypothetical protein
VVDVLTRLIDEPDSNYSRLFYAWYAEFMTARAAKGKKVKAGWTADPFTTMNEALQAYRLCVSDHAPVILTLTY